MNNTFYKEMADRVVDDVRKWEINNTVTCEKCGSYEVTEISYGLPGWIVIDDNYIIDPRITELQRQKKIVLGGCVVSEDSPKYYCRKCKCKFGLMVQL